MRIQYEQNYHAGLADLAHAGRIVKEKDAEEGSTPTKGSEEEIDEDLT